MEPKKKFWQSHIFILALLIAAGAIYGFVQLIGISPESIEGVKAINPDLAALFQAWKDKSWGVALTAVSAIWIAIRRWLTANPAIG